MMHYIPSDPARDETVGHQKHTDISSLTLLFAEEWGSRSARQVHASLASSPLRMAVAIINVGDSLRFASDHTFMSCIHRVVPFDSTEHRYSIAYFLRAENESMFKDSEGRYVTAGQWHDEKFFVFKATPEEQAKAPASILYGGMSADEDVTPYSVVPKVVATALTEAKETLVEAH